MTNPALPLFLDTSNATGENHDVRWYATADATEPMTCTACGRQLGNAPFSVGDDGARHETCPDGEKPEG